MCRVREEDMEESVLQSVSIDIPVFCPLNAYPLQILFKNIYECIVHSVLFAVTRSYFRSGGLQSTVLHAVSLRNESETR